MPILVPDGHHCPRCSKRVYFAEEVIALGKHWHKSCFVCANPDCKKRLDSRNCSDHNGDAYCTHCYGRLFGPKGYGYGVGAGILQVDGAPTSQAYQQALAAPILDSRGSSDRSSMSSPDSAASPAPAPHRNNGSRNSSLAGSSGRLWGGTEICRRCAKPVYMAERMMAAGAPWHKMGCFTCASCAHKLESTTLCEREGEIYCKTCYGRSFGPKGYGYGVGAGVLQSE